MKKSPIYLYILGGLSIISVLSRIKGTFFPKAVETVFEKTGNAEVDKMMAVSADIAKQRAAVDGNFINKFLVLVMVALLIAVIVFLFKKEVDKAGWIYVGYLGTTLLETVYTFLMFGHIFKAIEDEKIRQMMFMSFNVGIVINLLIFAVFLGITLYNLFKKPKDELGDTTGLV